VRCPKLKIYNSVLCVGYFKLQNIISLNRRQYRSDLNCQEFSVLVLFVARRSHARFTPVLKRTSELIWTVTSRIKVAGDAGRLSAGCGAFSVRYAEFYSQTKKKNKVGRLEIISEMDTASSSNLWGNYIDSWSLNIFFVSCESNFIRRPN
jgi:hypothetical protein